MKRFCVPVFVVLVLFSPNLTAQEEGTPQNSELLHFYDGELFQWNFTMFGGFMLNYRHQVSSPFWGLRAAMKSALFSYPETKKYAESYIKLNRAGNIFSIGGVAAMLASCFVPLIFDNIWDASADQLSLGGKIMFGGLIGGWALATSGGIMSTMGQEQLYQAVNGYNRRKIGEFKQGG